LAVAVGIFRHLDIQTEPADFRRRKVDWLLAVAVDKRLRIWAPLAVAVAIFHHLNSESEEAPNVKLLAAMLQLNHRRVQRALDRLVAAGYLSRQDGGSYRVNVANSSAEGNA
jgi:hypothetical protein